ncbi:MULTISPECIES: hypothetical protein [unclassified Tardiphaga]|uniref:hypothetical protein n=1 Tax=unclassified Tardiphaga TaxID=2631404 RepID=UPI001AEE0978|nr:MULTISPECIES: hypothetical protein [unclassified Tardiphaga]
MELGPYRNLVIDAVANELDRAHAREYLDDFRDELVWLAIGKPTGALGEVESDYIPKSDWVEHVVMFSTQATAPRATGFTVRFTRQRPSMTAQLVVEPVLANGKRPDFRLRFKVSASTAAEELEDNHDMAWGYRPSIFGNPPGQHSGLVMDAKFRTRWNRGELADMLRLLVDTKDYGQDGDRVFILHPAKGAAGALPGTDFRSIFAPCCYDEPEILPS